MTIFYTIIRNDEQIELTIDGTFHGGSRGSRDSCGGVAGAGPPLEPDEPPTFEIEHISPNHELTAEEEEAVIMKALDKAESEARESEGPDIQDSKYD